MGQAQSTQCDTDTDHVDLDHECNANCKKGQCNYIVGEGNRQYCCEHCSQGQLEATHQASNPIEVNPNGSWQTTQTDNTACRKQTSDDDMNINISKNNMSKCSKCNNDIKLQTIESNRKHHKISSLNFPMQLVKSVATRAIGKVDVESASKDSENFARKLSNVSQHRNIQLLSMKPRSERETFVDDLRGRRRSSLINLILGGPSSGPRFCDDLCSISSRLTNFGIEYFPDYNHGQSQQWTCNSSVCGSLKSNNNNNSNNKRLGPARMRFSATQSIESAASSSETIATISSSFEPIAAANANVNNTLQLQENNNDNNKHRNVHRRRSSEGSLAESVACNLQRKHLATLRKLDSLDQNQSTLASIDLTSSFDRHLPINCYGDLQLKQQKELSFVNKPTNKMKMKLFPTNGDHHNNKSRINVSGKRFLRRSGSELSLYSTNGNTLNNNANNIGSRQRNCNLGDGKDNSDDYDHYSNDIWRENRTFSEHLDKKEETTNKMRDPMRETKLLIILQVCLPFIFAGFGNMGAGLVLSRLASWDLAQYVSTFLVILPPLVGLKGNIEMTLASRLSTLANLNLLDTKYRRKRAFLSNLTLILSQAIGLSLFASIVAIICEFGMSSYGLTGAHVSTHHGLNGQQQQQQQANYNTTSTSYIHLTPTLLHNNNHDQHHDHRHYDGQQHANNDHLGSGFFHDDLLASKTYANFTLITNTTTTIDDPNYIAINQHQHQHQHQLQQQQHLDMVAQILLLIASALTTSLLVVFLSSFIMSCAIMLARLIQVNPDNLSTLIAALYGDCSFVLIYGLITSSMYKLMIRTNLTTKLIESVNLLTPSLIIGSMISLWPLLLYGAYKFKETHAIALSSLPPMLASIMISMGSGEFSF